MSRRNSPSYESNQDRASSDRGDQARRGGDAVATSRPNRSARASDGADAKVRFARPVINTSLGGPSSYQGGAHPSQTAAEIKL